jgi:hypothetical protein
MIFIIDKLINYLIYIFLIHFCFRIQFRKNKLLCLLSVLSVVFSGIVDLFLGEEYMVVFIIWALIAMILLFDDMIWHMALLTIALTWFMGMIDTFSSIIVQVIAMNTTAATARLTWNELFAYPISFGIEFLLYLCVLKQSDVYLNEIKLTYKLGLLLMTLIFELMAVGVFSVYYENPGNFTWYLHIRFLLCLVGTIYALYVTLALAVKNHLYDKQNKHLQLALNIQQSQYQFQKEKNIDLRRFRHDLINHIGAVKELISKGQYEKANSYIEQIWDVTESLSSKANTRDDYLDAILNYYSYICEAGNVAFEISGKLKRPLEIDLMDITALFGNALQNAYEAALKVSIKHVQIEMVDHEEEVFFTIANTCDGKNLPDYHDSVTSKADKYNHGFGLKSMINVINKYKGECYFSMDKKEDIEVFRIDFSIPRGSQI